MTPSNGNFFRVWGFLWYVWTNGRALKQGPRRRWFETPWCSLWRHCNVMLRNLLFWRSATSCCVICFFKDWCVTSKLNRIMYFAFERKRKNTKKSGCEIEAVIAQWWTNKRMFWSWCWKFRQPFYNGLSHCSYGRRLLRLSPFYGHGLVNLLVKWRFCCVLFRIQQSIHPFIHLSIHFFLHSCVFHMTLGLIKTRNLIDTLQRGNW